MSILKKKGPLLAKCSSLGLVQRRGLQLINLSLVLSLVFLFLFFTSPDPNVSLLYIVSQMHLDFTLGELGSHSLDTCPIKALLVGLTLKF